MFLLSLMMACQNENGVYRLDHVDRFHQEGSDEVDVLWVIDDSNSMENEQEAVAGGFTRFVQALNGGETELDLHLGITTTDMDLANPDRGQLIGDPPFITRDDPGFELEFMQRVRVGVEGSDKERGLESAWFALNRAEASQFLRPEATLALVFVSDENDCSHEGSISDEADGSTCYQNPTSLVPVQDYIERFRDLKGQQARVVASGILGPDVSQGCAASWPGHRYEAIARTLDGVVGNICETDFGDILDGIGEAIIAPARTFHLTYLPLEESIEVELDGEIIEPDEDATWWFDAADNSVRFDGELLPEHGSTIEVYYTIASG